MVGINSRPQSEANPGSFSGEWWEIKVSWPTDHRKAVGSLGVVEMQVPTLIKTFEARAPVEMSGRVAPSMLWFTMAMMQTPVPGTYYTWAVGAELAVLQTMEVFY